MDLEGTVDSTEVSPTLIKFEREDSVPLAEFKGEDNLWTPEKLMTRASQLTQQVGRLAKASREETMAREGEKCELVRIMELMMQMRAEDTKAAQVREENRI